MKRQLLPSRNDKGKREWFGRGLRLCQEALRVPYRRKERLRLEWRIRLEGSFRWLQVEEGAERTEWRVRVGKRRVEEIVRRVERRGKAFDRKAKPLAESRKARRWQCALASEAAEGLVAQQHCEGECAQRLRVTAAVLRM